MYCTNDLLVIRESLGMVYHIIQFQFIGQSLTSVMLCHILVRHCLSENIFILKIFCEIRILYTAVKNRILIIKIWQLSSVRKNVLVLVACYYSQASIVRMYRMTGSQKGK